MKEDKLEYMSEKLLNYKEIIEDSTHELWKGHGTDIAKLNGVIYDVSNLILKIAESLNEEDKITTISYVKNALSDFESACNNMDDYMMADCLYFEWRELISIYIEEMGD